MEKRSQLWKEMVQVITGSLLLPGVAIDMHTIFTCYIPAKKMQLTDAIMKRKLRREPLDQKAVLTR